MEIESVANPEDEEEKNLTNYNGNYDENLDKYLKIFMKKERSIQFTPKPIKNLRYNPFPLQSRYLAKRKFEYYFILSKSFKKIKGLLYTSNYSKSRYKEKIFALPKKNQ